MIFETRCAGCDRPGAPICTTCRFVLAGAVRQPAPGHVIAAVPFAGRARDVVLGLKYRNRRAVGRHLAGLLVNRVVDLGLVDRLDLVTWAPTSARRRRERGFDQAELLAQAVARQLGLPCRRLLDRRSDLAQTGRSRLQRLSGPSFVARPGLDGRRVLVIDDVVTTGATLDAAVAALEGVGAYAIPAAVASTPAERPVLRSVPAPAA